MIYSNRWVSGTLVKKTSVLYCSHVFKNGRFPESEVPRVVSIGFTLRKMVSTAIEKRSSRDESTVGEKRAKRWYWKLWDSFDKSAEERKFLSKLDAALLTFASLTLFIKKLDTVNVNSAFVSGMKEELGLNGNQLNYLHAVWAVGYMIGQVPSNTLITRVRPSMWIPIVELIWSVLTLGMAFCRDVRWLYALRFFLGLAESPSFPAINFIFGSWYRKDELGKRCCICLIPASLGYTFSGILMAAAYRLDGVRELSGWQWLFIVDGMISMPVGLASYWLIPDMPENTKAFYLSEDERKLAQRRMRLEGRQEKQPYTKAKIIKILRSWRLYLLCLLETLVFNSIPLMPVFQQYLKKEGFSVAKTNLYPSLNGVVAVVFIVLAAWSSDSFLRGRRWPPIIVAGVLKMVSSIPLAAWNIPEGFKWTCYLLEASTAGLPGLVNAWANEICTGDREERAIVLASMNSVAMIVIIWLPLVVWQQVDSPNYRLGFITLSCLAFCLIPVSLLVRYMHGRQRTAQVQYPVEAVEEIGQ